MISLLSQPNEKTNSHIIFNTYIGIANGKNGYSNSIRF